MLKSINNQIRISVVFTQNSENKFFLNKIKMLSLQKTREIMILNLQFKNFRSFKNVCCFTTEPTASKAKPDNICIADTKNEGEKNALKISLIFGANASGKTNIIKYMYGFKRWILNLDNRVGEDIPLYMPFKFNSDTAEAPIEFSIEFIAGKIRYIYTLRFEKTKVLEESLQYYPLGRPVVLYERLPLDEDRDSDSIKFGSSLSSNTCFNVFKNQLLLSKFLKDTPCEPITEAAKYLTDIIVSNGFHEDCIRGEDKEIFRWLYSHPDNVRMLSEFLSFADTGVAGLQLDKRSDRVDVSGLHGLYRDGKIIGKTDLPLKEESFGTRALFIIGCKIIQSLQNGSPFFVDEMDSGLHSYVTQLIVDIFRSKRINNKNAQLIFTTHDVNLLNQNTIRRDQVWFTEKNKYGESEIFPLSDFSDVREDANFGKWYMNNKFGGVPSLQPLEKLFAENGKE